MASVERRHLEGELGRARPENGALAAIPAKYALFAGSPTPNPELISAVRAGVESVTQAMAPWAAPYMYLNFAESRREPTSLWTESVYHRLQQIKAAVDPGDMILSNHPIAPAA